MMNYTQVLEKTEQLKTGKKVPYIGSLLDKFSFKNEYNVEIRLEPLPYEHIRWIENKEEVDVQRLQGTSDMKKIKDLKGRPLLLFVNEWSIRMTEERNKGLILTEFAK